MREGLPSSPPLLPNTSLGGREYDRSRRSYSPLPSEERAIKGEGAGVRVKQNGKQQTLANRRGGESGMQKGIGVLLAVGMLWSSGCGAQSVYPPQTFTFDTSALSEYSGPFQLDFQLTDGSGTGDGNTSLTVDNFMVDGVSAPGIAAASLADSAFFSEVMRGFM